MARVAAPDHAAHPDDVRAHVGDELTPELVALYDGGADWTTRAIDVLEPLHALTRS